MGLAQPFKEHSPKRFLCFIRHINRRQRYAFKSDCRFDKSNFATHLCLTTPLLRLNPSRLHLGLLLERGFSAHTLVTTSALNAAGTDSNCRKPQLPKCAAHCASDGNKRQLRPSLRRNVHLLGYARVLQQYKSRQMPRSLLADLPKSNMYTPAIRPLI
jgi:hypothetical protein